MSSSVYIGLVLLVNSPAVIRILLSIARAAGFFRDPVALIEMTPIHSLSAALLTMTLGVTASAADPPLDATSGLRASRFCVLPVRDGTPTEDDVGSTWRIVTDAHHIPGLGAPVYTPHNRRGQWTIDTERRLVPYGGVFPRSIGDRTRWIREPWSSRVVASAGSRGVLVLDPGEDDFRPVDTSAVSGGKPFSRPYLLASRRLTIVLAAGVPYVVERSRLRPLWSREQLSQSGISGIYTLHDASSLQATIVLTSDRRLFVFTDDDQWHHVFSLGDKGAYASVFQLPDIDAVVIRSSRQNLVIRRERTRNGFEFSAKLLGRRRSGDGSDLHSSRLFGQLLRFGSGGFFDWRDRWQRLGREGFEDVPGGETGIMRADLYPHGAIRESRTLRRVIIPGREQLFSYDGQSITPIAGSGVERLGDLPWIADLSSIGRTLVASSTGLFEITADQAVVELDMPFTTSGYPIPRLVDWPEARAVIVASKEGLFALDENLDAYPFQGGSTIGAGFGDPDSGTIAATGAKVLKGVTGLFLAMDTRIAGSAACEEHFRRLARVPAANLCVTPIHGTEGEQIGDRSGDWIEAPDGTGVLFDTRSGIHYLSSDGEIRSLEPSGRPTSGFVRLPWSGEVLAIGKGIVGRDLTLSRMHDVGTFAALLPSRKAMLFADSGSRQTVTIVRRRDGAYRATTIKGRRNDFRLVADAPWLGYPIFDSTEGLQGLDEGDKRFALKIDTRASDAVRTSSKRVLSYKWWPLGPRRVWPLDSHKAILVWRQGWFRITEDLAWTPVRGLGADVQVRAALDRGRGDIILGTSKGIYTISSSGAARPLGGALATRRNVRALVESPDGGGFLAGGDDGLFRVADDMPMSEPFAEGIYDIVGGVRSIVDAGFSGYVLVFGSNGTFAVDKAGRLTSVADLTPASKQQRITAFPRLRRVLAYRPSDPRKAMFFEVRADSAPACAVASRNQITRPGG